MAAPTTYAAWASLLDKFGEGDDSILEDLSSGSFVLDAGTASRFYDRVERAYKKRKQSWLHQFQRSMQLNHLKSEDDFAIIFRNGRQSLSPLNKFVMLNALPIDLRNVLLKDLEDFVAEIKASLKDNVSKVSNEREKILLLLNSFGLTTITPANNTDTNNDNNNNNNHLPPTGRKIIF